MNPWDPQPRQIDSAAALTERMLTSSLPHWREVRARLDDLGVDLGDVVLTEWEKEDPGLMGGIVVTRSGRVVRFLVRFEFDRHRRPLEKGVGWIQEWGEIPSVDIRPMPSGVPNSWLAALNLARAVFEQESRRPGETRPREDGGT